MGRARESWYERLEVKKVTSDWVKTNCKLTEREKELLPIIYKRKLVRRDHLEIISPTYRKLSNRTSLLNRAIKKLFKQMVIDKVHEKSEMGKGSNPSIVSLDKAGAIIIDKPFKRRIIHRKTTHNGKEFIIRRLPLNIRHINGINEIEVKTILFCEDNNYEIVSWEIEKGRTFKHNDTEILFIPDIMIVLKIDDLFLPCFIEYDTGSEGLREREPKVIEEKLMKYKRYKASYLWEKEEWNKYANGFPLLLFVTEDNNRIKFVNDKAKELGVQTLALYYENYSNVLDKVIKLLKKKTSTK